jgi:predicted phage-related endonuclease
MTLTPEQLAKREGRLTASRVGCLMSGDEGKILNLWREMVGSAEFVPDDLDDVWAVQLGSFTEALNLDWYERRTGHPVTRRGEVVIHLKTDWAAATLDGWDDILGVPIECKHVGGYEKREVVVARYQPQFHWIMSATGTTRLITSIIEGAKEPIREYIAWDAPYGAELWRRAEEFMRCVQDLVEPFVPPMIEPPVDAIKTYDMRSSNAWAEHSAIWLRDRSAAKSFEAAAAEIKALVPADAKRAFGHGIEIAKAKNGAITIREEEKKA